MRHKAWRAVSRGAAVALLWALDTIGEVEIVTLVGLTLLAIGLWWLSPAAALIVTGLILLWVVLPARLPFIVRRDKKDGS
jgi:divalent metal cation (Fe/Co/Zn/Cd) transporter